MPSPTGAELSDCPERLVLLLETHEHAPAQESKSATRFCGRGPDWLGYLPNDEIVVGDEHKSVQLIDKRGYRFSIELNHDATQ